MFDSGNYLNVRAAGEWRAYLPYTQDCSGEFAASAGVADVLYATCKLSDGFRTTDGAGEAVAGTLFSAALSSATSAIQAFTITGDLGADGHGRTSYATLKGARGVRAYYKQVYGAGGGDPSINHLVLATADIDRRSRPARSTNSDWQV